MGHPEESWKKKNRINKTGMASDRMIRVAHLFLFAPFVFYMGLTVPKAGSWCYRIALFLGAYVILAWCYRIWISDYTIGWVAWHMVVVGGLLLACGLYQDRAPRIVFSLLLAMGFAAFGYHLTRLIQSVAHHP